MRRPLGEAAFSPLNPAFLPYHEWETDLNQQPKDENAWPLSFDSLAWPKKLSSSTATVAVLIFIFLVFIAILSIGWLLADLVSGDQKRASEAVKAALPLLAAAIGLPLLVWRLRILDRQTRISDEKTQIDRETHYTSIFSRGIEQLGQTREIKRTVRSATSTIDTTTTVPNIEVRLGGIHSLSRLAEESLRDREKIGNILRSYIRENSWSDRAGELANKPDWLEISPWEWAYKLARNPSNIEAKEAKNTWTAGVKDLVAKLHEWAKQIPETRVDVNEAADALAFQAVSSIAAVKPVFYECLFVGRHFSATLLSLTNFRRCTFIKCTFEASEHSRLIIEDSFVFSCDFLCSNAEIAIHSSQLSEIVFNRSQNSKIELHWCNAYSMRVRGRPSRLNLSDCSFYQLRLLGGRSDGAILTTTIDFDDSVLVESILSRLTLSADCDLNFASAPDIEFDHVDLSAVSNFDEKMLSEANVDAQTVHPASIERPSSWPAARS